MITYKTGSRSTVCNTGTDTNPGDSTGPVHEAKARTMAAQADEEKVTQEQQLANSKKDATAKRSEAQSRSDDAFKTQPNSAAGRKAHQTAALAHGDAQKAFSKLANEQSGNDLDTRAKCQKCADDHGAMATKHKAIGSGDTMSKTTLNTGSRRVVCNVEGLTENVWSDAAREASAEARAMSAKAHESGSVEDHLAAAQSHRNASDRYTEKAVNRPGGTSGGNNPRKDADLASARFHENEAKYHLTKARS